MGCSREPHPGREDAETGPAGTGAVVQHGRPRSLTGDRRRRMLYRAIAFSLGGAGAAGPGAGVCADAEATGPVIGLTRGIGRGSCRGRGENSVVAGSLKKKKKGGVVSRPRMTV